MKKISNIKIAIIFSIVLIAVTATTLILEDKFSKADKKEDQQDNMQNEEDIYTYYIDQEFVIPELPIVYETDDISLAQYKDFTIKSGVKEYSVSMEEVEDILNESMSSYAASIGEDPETYIYDDDTIVSMTSGECTTYDELKQYLYDMYNANAKATWEMNKQYACYYAVIKNSKIDEESEEWLRFYDDYKLNYEIMAIDYGYEDLESYANAMGVSIAFLKDMIYNEALIEYKTDLVCNVIAEKEGYSDDMKEVQDIIENNASIMNMTKEEYLQSFMSETDILKRLKEDFVENLIFDSVKFE